VEDLNVIFIIKENQRVDKTNLLNKLKPEIVKLDQAMRDDLKDLAARDLAPANLLEPLEHALFNGGKRIRPLLCILAARLCSSAPGNKIYPLAIAFEYLHVATLLHDDVIDHAETRRGRPTVNETFGLTAAILAGDFLHARSLFLIGTIGGRRCLDLICRATEAMVAGEFLQLANARNLNQSENDYFAVIKGKTALFIGAVCEIGGIFAGADEMYTKQLRQYGANLGLAFQIQDDLLDYLGDAAKTGKTVGNDFFEGKMTLPLLHTLETAGDKEKDFLLGLLGGDKRVRKEKLFEARKIIHDNGGFDYAAKLAEKLVDTAIKSLASFSSDQNKDIVDILTGLAGYVINRDK